MTRSGAEYIRAQQDGRAVYMDGERLDDVTRHPAFAEAVRTTAHLYDIANDPANRELMTFPSPRDGRPVNRAYSIPRDRGDLLARRLAHKRWADATYGLMGRSPDHVASFLAGFAGSADFFGQAGPQFADNIRRFHAKASDEDLYLAYTIVHPTVDRLKPAHEQAEPNTYASVYKERDDGVILRGAMMIGTGAVMADYTFVSVILPLIPGDEDYAISLVVPNNAPGLKLYPRRPYSMGRSSVFDYPLSTRLDETDSLLVFDDVFVPWEEVFIYRNIELTRDQWRDTGGHTLGNTQALIRSWTKLEFMVGLVKRITDRSGTSARPDTKVQLGQLAARASLVEGLVLAADAKAALNEYGVMVPDTGAMYANLSFQSSLYPEVIDQIRTMMGGSLIQLPSSAADFGNPEIAADLERYVKWPHADARERVKLLRLLWDLVGSEFAGRHVQYEMFYAGGPTAVSLRGFSAYDWASAESLVDDCLATFDLDTEAASTPPPDAR
jgi:4-hydroxyphenylacetate 3-monooxygenase